jgi:hypothetical protein
LPWKLKTFVYICAKLISDLKIKFNFSKGIFIMKLHEEFKLYENLWESVETSALNEDWYGADAEVEFETSVYPDIAKYFGLKDDEVVTYAYYFTDEVIVNYDDATGHSHEIEKHVPLDQVEEWFKAGYTILDEGQVNCKKLKESTAYTEKDFAWDDATIVADFKRAVMDYLNGANLDDALHDIKLMIISGVCSALDPVDVKGLMRKECAKYGIYK